MGDRPVSAKQWPLYVAPFCDINLGVVGIVGLFQVQNSLQWVV